MIRARLLRLLAVIATAWALTLQGFAAASVARADVLSNGIDVTCHGEEGHAPLGRGPKWEGLVCVAHGCPGTYAGGDPDAIHTMINGSQAEFEYRCSGVDWFVPAYTDKPFTFGVQICRKETFQKDSCMPYADYTYTPPAAPPIQCPAGSESPTVPAGQQCKAAPKPPVVCPEGSPTKTVPAGQECAPIPDVTNAIQASFGAPGVSSIAFNVKNTSKIEATCHYVATTDSLNPLVAKETTRQFNVPANGPHTETFNGAATFTTYKVVLSCFDASGKQKAELGHVETSVFW